MKRIFILFVLPLMLGVSSDCYSFTEKSSISVDNFFTRPSIDGIRISPDGKYYAARAEVNGSKNLIIMDRITHEQVYFFNFGDDEKEVGSFGWLNNKRIYASMIRKVGPLERPSQTGYLFAGDIDGTKMYQLLPQVAKAGKGSDVPRRFSIVDILENDPKHILIQMGKFNSSRNEIVKLQVYSGKQKVVSKTTFNRSFISIDHSAQARIVTSYDDNYNVKTVYYRENEDADWVKVDKRDTEKSTYEVITFTPDNSQFYYFSAEKGGIQGVYLFDPNTKESKLVHEVKGDQSIQSYIIDDKTKQLIGLVREKGKLTKEYFEGFDELTNYYKQLDKAFEGQHVDVLNETFDNKLAILAARSDRNAGTFYLQDKKTGQVKFLMNIRPNLPANKMSERRPISFEARDGLEIRGFITLPNKKQKDLPMVVLVHGGPYGIADNWAFSDIGSLESQFLAHNGYAVLQVNYRGSGGRGLDFIYDNYRKMGKEMQDDLTDATLWAVKEGFADKNRICIYGASYGGYASLMGVVKEPDLYKCAIGYAGVYDIAVQAEESDTRGSDSGREFLVDAWNAYDEKFVKERSAAYHVDKIKAALFLVHGTSDKRTPLSNYTILAKKLDDIGYPYEKLIKEDEGHGFYTEKNQIELYTKMLSFLEKHIGK